MDFLAGILTFAVALLIAKRAGYVKFGKSEKAPRPTPELPPLEIPGKDDPLYPAHGIPPTQEEVEKIAAYWRGVYGG